MARSKHSKRPGATKKPPLTHFLCLPLITSASKPQLEESLERFRQDVSLPTAESSEGTNVEEHNSSKIHAKAIRPVGALHCTLGVMSLKQGELPAAKMVLEGLDMSNLLEQSFGNGDSAAKSTATKGDGAGPPSLSRSISPPPHTRHQQDGPLTVDLKGLESMHAAHKTSILYTAPFDASGRLYPFCLAVQKVFKDKGLLVEDSRQLKLHATIVNTIYAKGRKKRLPRSKVKEQTPKREQAEPTDESMELVAKADATEDHEVLSTENGADATDDRSQGHGPDANAPLKIDARAILEKYKDFVWAKGVVLDRVAICEMGAKKKLDANGVVITEEYSEVASVALPT